MSAELIARLEAATEGSRELDGLIAKAFGWHRVEPRFARTKAGGWIAPEDFIGLRGDGSPILDGLHGTTIYRDPPRLTQSVDAVLALAEKALPECKISIVKDDGPDGGPKFRWSAQVALYSLCGPVGRRDWWFGVSDTPALALCIAVLKAKEVLK